jgi:hypothetical protein
MEIKRNREGLSTLMTETPKLVLYPYLAWLHFLMRRQFTFRLLAMTAQSINENPSLFTNKAKNEKENYAPSSFSLYHVPSKHYDFGRIPLSFTHPLG